MQDKGDYDKTIADCTEAIRLDPQNVNAYCERGGAWGKKGEYDRAIADFTKAIRLDRQNVSAYCKRGAYAYNTAPEPGLGPSSNGQSTFPAR